LIGSVRGLRKEYELPAAEELEVHLTNVPDVLRSALDIEERAVRRLARVRAVRADGAGRRNGEGREPGAHAVLRSGAELFIPLADVIDLDRERQRLGAELERIGKLLDAVEKKLGNRSEERRVGEAVVA